MVKLNFAILLLVLSGFGHLAEGGYLNLPMKFYFSCNINTSALLFPGRNNCKWF